MYVLNVDVVVVYSHQERAHSTEFADFASAVTAHLLTFFCRTLRWFKLCKDQLCFGPGRWC